MKPGQPAKILVVDDDARNLKLMAVQLQPLGHQIHTAEDGRQALELVEQIEPDLILLDVMMPDVDGYHVLEKIKRNRNTRDIPVVMITALSDTESRVRAYDLGADDFISKPPDRLETLARVRSLLKVKSYKDEMSRYRENLEKEVARITQQLHHAYTDLKRASLDTIYRLSRASEFKDTETGVHIQRVSKFSQAIARRMGLGERIQDALLYAAPMHDVGKIGIPDEILLKPGALDEAEWAIMKTHTQIGARILGGSDSDILKMGEEIALTHHEWWNGTGYPNGLSGEQIPVTGRIVAVADVFDALTSPRPYRGPLSDEEALKIMVQGTGSQFSPQVMDAFHSLGDEINQIRRLVDQKPHGDPEGRNGSADQRFGPTGDGQEQVAP